MISGPLPTDLGRYRLTRRIGSGAMGVVYQGEDPVIGRLVAVKVMRVDMLEQGVDAGYRERFRHEVRAAGRCVHPGIVTIFDYAEQDGIPYIVMEYLEGEPLQVHIGQTPMPVPDAVALALQMLDALEHAHSRGVVHRDIKPSNIIVGTGGSLGPQIKITDFGIARVAASALTDAGLLLGTPSYISPERARGEPTDLRADLFAMGVVLYRMVMGNLPYGDADVAAVLHRTAGPQPVDLRALDARAPNLTPIMASALAKDPRERFASAAAFAGALRELAHDRSRDDIWPLTPAEAAAAAGGNPALARLRPDGAWPAPLLAALQAALTEALGPIAGFLLPRIAGTCHDGAALVENLGRTVDDKAARARFLARATEIALRQMAEPGLARAAEQGSARAAEQGSVRAAEPGPASGGGALARPAPAARVGPLAKVGSFLRTGSLSGVSAIARVVSAPATTRPGPAAPAEAAAPAPSVIPALPVTPTPPAVAPQPGPEVIAAAQQLLARFIGPIARVVVRQSAPGLGSIEELGERLGASIAQPAARDAFRKAFASEIAAPAAAGGRARKP